MIRSRSIFDKKNIFNKLEKINKQIEDPSFWANKSNVEKTLKEKKTLDDLTKSYLNSKSECKEILELYELAVSEKNQEILEEIKKNIEKIKRNSKQNEIKCFLSKETDILDTYLEIHAGAGGTESQDWADMLRRMYLKWSSSKNYKVQLISEHKGDEAGIKSSIIKIQGEYTYGMLKARSGIQIGKDFSMDSV